MLPGRKGFKDFRKEMREAARETEHTAAVVGGAANFWAKAGKTTQQTKAVIPITLDFASANEDAAGSALDAARAGDILSDALGQFRLDSSDPTVMMANTARVADVMSAAANSANFSAEELFESYKEAGPVLSAVGGDIEGTSAYLAAMANAGVKGARAGTALKIAITALNAPTARQADLLAKYTNGVKDAEGNFRGLSTVVGELVKSTEKLGTGDRFEVLSQIIGRRGTAPFINLLVKGQVELDKMADSLRGASGETKRLAEITRTSATAQMQKFWGKITDLGFTVIEQTKLFDRLGKAIEGIDWVAAADFVIKDLVPALVWAGDVIKNTLWPAFKEMASMLKAIFMPIINVLSSMFGWLSEEGGGLAKVLGTLGALMISSRVLGAIGRLTMGIGGATTGLSGMGMAAGTGTKMLGVLSKSAGLLQVAFAAWTIGTIFYNQVIEPLQKALFEAKKLENHLKSIEDVGPENFTKGVLEKASKDYDKQIAEKTSKLEALKSRGTEKSSEGKIIQQQIESLRAKKRDIDNSIAIKKTAGNVNKYGGPVARSDETQTTSRVPELYTEFEDDWAMATASHPIEIKVVPDPQSIEDFGNQMSIPVEGDFKHSEEYLGRSSIPESARSWESELGFTKDMLRHQKQMALEQQAYHQQMIEAQTKASKTGEITQNFAVAGATVTVNAQGGDPKEIARMVERQLKAHEREQTAALRQAGREAAPAEF